MAILGIDLGYSFTKTSEGFICPSRITKVEPLLGYSKTLELNEKYYVGTGNGTIELNKIDKEITKVLLIYAICASTKDEKVKIVTGLPIGQYREYKDELKQMILSLRTVRCLFNGLPRTITIEGCIIRPQGILGGLTVDIGGRTVDVSCIEDSELKYAKTIYEGMLNFYSKIIEAVNAKYCLSLPDYYAQKILTNGFYLNDEKKDTTFLKAVIEEYVDKIVEEMKMASATSKAALCGGGAKLLFGEINKRYPAFLAAEPQFANAYQYRKYGEKKWLS